MRRQMRVPPSGGNEHFQDSETWMVVPTVTLMICETGGLPNLSVLTEAVGMDAI